MAPPTWTEAVWILLTLSGSLADAATLKPVPNDILKKRQANTPFSPVADRFTPHPAPVNWAALGDSYTSGPGTGTDYDSNEKCARNIGSYAVQTQLEFPFNVPNNLDFIACSGGTSPSTLAQAKTIPQGRDDFMVMTLGGNDIGFSDIAIECLVKAGIFPGDCDDTLAKAKAMLAAPKFETDIHAVYDQIFAKMKDDRHYQLYHIFYHRFFNAETTECDKKTFALINPRLIRTLRVKLNNLADSLNARLEQVAQNYIRKQAGKPSWSQGSRLIALNPDKLTNSAGQTYGLFDGHRFCEAGVSGLRDPSVWFFATVAKDSLEKREEWVDDLGRRQFVAPELATQTFHPRSAGFRAVKRMLQESLQRNRPAEG
ncbi:MAG: hypothetical protein Q9221_007677 [Calogaya cf. arnoldii]